MSEENKLGIKPSEENIQRAASFMSDLSSDQRQTFLSLMAERKEVDFSEKGSNAGGAFLSAKSFSEEELDSGEAIIKLAEQKRKANTNLSQEEAEREAERELLSEIRVDLKK